MLKDQIIHLTSAIVSDMVRIGDYEVLEKQNGG